MEDMFDNVVICSNCNCRMHKTTVEKNGFILRALQCPKCMKKIYHPQDIAEYKQFAELRNKTFAVKLRMVGNSYTVSIPKEIVEFIKEQERIMSDMVSLCFEEAGRLSLEFGQHAKNIKDKIDNINRGK